ncbi:SDR family oxidoreductase [Actinomadura atramentaria]|uniref:SDR family oxidoreductase n=1 Tax=Actinomadura atramentaria TaxID=1990 RepID=UPI0003796421|nr:SDR family oxidoreductase [Actinomadura atramentaria]
MAAETEFTGEIIGIGPFGRPAPRVAVAVARAGGLGVLDLGVDRAAALAALGEVARWWRGPFGVRVPAGCPVRPDDLPDAVRTVLVDAAALRPGAPLDVAGYARGRRTLVEVVDPGEAAAALALVPAVDGLVARGAEAGGRVGDRTSFTLLRRLLDELPADFPVFAAGGMGPHAAAAAVAGGAAGVVLDVQFALVREMELPADVAAALAAMDGGETRVVEGHRIYARPDLPDVDLSCLDLAGITARLGPAGLAVAPLPVGQDGYLAAPLAARHRTAGGVVQAVRRAIGEHLRAAARVPAAPDAAPRVAYRVPLGFPRGAAAVARAGGLPFVVLPETVRDDAVLAETARRVGGLPWGVELPGPVPPEARAAHLAAVAAVRPPFALLGGGRPGEAAALEDAGVRAYLHAPEPALLDGFLAAGVRRFAFEGAERAARGGRACLPLWDAQVGRLLAFAADRPDEPLSVLFAGGVPDERSAAMVAALAGPLAERGADVRVLVDAAWADTRPGDGRSLPERVADLHRNVTEGAARFLADRVAALGRVPAAAPPDAPPEVAVVGVGCAFPDAPDAAEFWARTVAPSAAPVPGSPPGLPEIAARALADAGYADRPFDRSRAAVVLGAADAAPVAASLGFGGAAWSVAAGDASALAALAAARRDLAAGTADLVVCGGADGPGGACLVLKRRADAERDGDRVYALVAAAESGDEPAHSGFDGLGGLVAAVFALHAGVLPGASGARPWLAPPGERTARAAASGAGTRYRAVLTGYDGAPDPVSGLAAWPAELFLVRGADADAALDRLAALARRPDVRLRDLARTCAADTGPLRCALVATGPADLRAKLAAARAGRAAPGVFPAADTPRGDVAFLYPDGDENPARPLTDLFLAFPRLRRLLRAPAPAPNTASAQTAASEQSVAAERRAASARHAASGSVAADGGGGGSASGEEYAGAVPGVAGLAVHRLLTELGVRPDLAAGHGHGELVALCAAGVFGDDDLAALGAARSAALLAAARGGPGTDDPGAMAAVAAPLEDVRAALDGLSEVVVARHDAPRRVVLSGSTPALDRAAARLAERGVRVDRLPAPCALHSPLVAGAAMPLRRALGARDLRSPAFPVWSNTTAAPCPADPGELAAALAGQVAAPVRFVEQVEAMYAAGARIFVEAGPGRDLTGYVGQILGDRPHTAVACDASDAPGLAGLLPALAELAAAGVPVDASALFAGRDATVLDETAPDETPHDDSASDDTTRDETSPNETPVPAPASAADTPTPPAPDHPPIDTGQAVLEYLRTGRELLAAQRDVILGLLAAHPRTPAPHVPAASPEPAPHSAGSEDAPTQKAEPSPQAEPAHTPPSADPADTRASQPAPAPRDAEPAEPRVPTPTPQAELRPAPPDAQPAAPRVLASTPHAQPQPAPHDAEGPRAAVPQAEPRPASHDAEAPRAAVPQAESPPASCDAEGLRAAVPQGEPRPAPHNVGGLRAPAPQVESRSAPPGAEGPRAAVPQAEPGPAPHDAGGLRAPAPQVESRSASYDAEETRAAVPQAQPQPQPAPHDAEGQRAAAPQAESQSAPRDTEGLRAAVPRAESRPASCDTEGLRAAASQAEPATSESACEPQVERALLDAGPEGPRVPASRPEPVPRAAPADACPPEAAVARHVEPKSVCVPGQPGAAGAEAAGRASAVDGCFRPVVGPVVRHVVRSVVVPPAAVPGAGDDRLAGADVVVVDDGGGIALALADLLERRGARVTVSARDDGAAKIPRDVLVQLAALRPGAGPVLPAAYCGVRAALAGGARRVLLAGAVGDALPGAGLPGLARALAAEHPAALVRAVDVDAKESPAALAALLLAELLDADGPAAVAYAGAVRRTLDTVPADLPAEPHAPLGLDADSVVLLTGAAHDLTARVARDLVAATGCRVELAGPDQAPGEGRHRVDVADAAAVRALVEAVRARHGRLDGVVHGAGLAAGRSVRDTSPAEFDRAYRAQAVGAAALAAAAPQGLRFFAVLGGAGGTAGAAAHDACGAFAPVWTKALGCRVLTAGWAPHPDGTPPDPAAAARDLLRELAHGAEPRVVFGARGR